MKKMITLLLCLLIVLSMVGCRAKGAGNGTTAMDGITVRVVEVIDSESCDVAVEGGNSAFSPGDTLAIHYKTVRVNGSDYTSPLKKGDLIAVTYENIEHSDKWYSISVEYVDLIETTETIID